MPNTEANITPETAASLLSAVKVPFKSGKFPDLSFAAPANSEPPAQTMPATKKQLTKKKAAPKPKTMKAKPARKAKKSVKAVKPRLSCAPMGYANDLTPENPWLGAAQVLCIASADLIGQLADVSYLRKTPALFAEFREKSALLAALRFWQDAR